MQHPAEVTPTAHSHASGTLAVQLNVFRNSIFPPSYHDCHDSLRELKWSSLILSELRIHSLSEHCTHSEVVVKLLENLDVHDAGLA